MSPAPAPVGPSDTSRAPDPETRTTLMAPGAVEQTRGPTAENLAGTMGGPWPPEGARLVEGMNGLDLRALARRGNGRREPETIMRRHLRYRAHRSPLTAAPLWTAAIVMSGLPAVVPPQLEAQSSWDESIDAFSASLARDAEADGIGSITAAVFVGDELAWSGGFGVTDRNTDQPAGPRNIYRTGSISKSVTAVLMMLMVQDGALGLDDPVAGVLPAVDRLAEPRPGQSPLTFRHLASHTGGLIREPELEGAASGPIANWESKILESIPHTRYQTEPGDAYSYSNIGYGILGLALARAAQRPFMDLVEERIFKPLGMSSSTFVVGSLLRPRLASGYVSRDGEIDAALPAREHAGRGYKVPNGGVYSTVGDLARFAAGVTGAMELLDEESRAAMLSIQTPESETRGYGLGFSLRRRRRLVGQPRRLGGRIQRRLVGQPRRLGGRIQRAPALPAGIRDWRDPLEELQRGTDQPQ